MLEDLLDKWPANFSERPATFRIVELSVWRVLTVDSVYTSLLFWFCEWSLIFLFLFVADWLPSIWEKLLHRTWRNFKTYSPWGSRIKEEVGSQGNFWTFCAMHKKWQPVHFNLMNDFWCLFTPLFYINNKVF